MSLVNGFFFHSEIDTTYFVLFVDLWKPDMSEEINVVRHANGSPSISAATPVPYPPNVDVYEPEVQGSSLTPGSTAPQIPSEYALPHTFARREPGGMMYPSIPGTYSLPVAYPPQVSQSFGPLPPGSYYVPGVPTPITPMTPTGPTGHMVQGQGPLLSPSALSTQSLDPRSNPSGMFSRNLIGSLCVSAFKLMDTVDQMGIWFILQDLSVRTEGVFRQVMALIRYTSGLIANIELWQQTQSQFCERRMS